MRKHCIEARVSLVQELTQAKRRGMDGFHFELCVHPTAKAESPEIDYEELACLDRYPSTSTLIKQNGYRIRQPKQLDLWYPPALEAHASPTGSVPVSKGFGKSLSKVVETILRIGQNQWYSFGVAMGFSDAEIDGITFNKSTGADKLLAIIRSKANKIGEKKTDDVLLEACKLLPLPIYGTVKDHLEK
jgi:hypothetical protein